MKEDRQLVNFLMQVSSDRTLTLTHISMCMALCSLWIENQFENPFPISRKVLMSAARLKSPATYHSVLKHLVAREHIVYSPSYDPAGESQASIISKPSRLGKRAFEKPS